MSDELKDQRIPVMMTPTEVGAIDDWAFANRIRSRAEAIRQLVSSGLKEKEYHAVFEASYNLAKLLLNKLEDPSDTKILSKYFEEVANLEKSLAAHASRLRHIANIHIRDFDDHIRMIAKEAHPDDEDARKALEANLLEITKYKKKDPGAA